MKQSNSLYPQNKHSLDVQGDRLIVKQPVRFDTVVSIYQESLSKMEKMNKVMIDFCSLPSCDSSILALCVAWSKTKIAQKKELSLINLPVFMQDLIRVHGLQKVLPLVVLS